MKLNWSHFALAFGLAMATTTVAYVVGGVTVAAATYFVALLAWHAVVVFAVYFGRITLSVALGIVGGLARLATGLVTTCAGAGRSLVQETPSLHEFRGTEDRRDG